MVDRLHRLASPVLAVPMGGTVWPGLAAPAIGVPASEAALTSQQEAMQ